jgi:hypothetical protein
MPICRLCGEDRELLLSHVIPAFVYKWLKRSSPTGHLRDSRTPNRRVQDDRRVRLFCSECEQRLARDEKSFREQVFAPLHEDPATPRAYQEWGLRFAVSVVWRGLVHNPEKFLGHLSDAQAAHAKEAERVWREFLLGLRPHPGRYQVRAIALDCVGRTTMPGLSPFANRYLLRAVGLDVVRGGSDVFVYAKLCRILLIGFVSVDRTADWEGGKLSPRSGTIGGSMDYVLPHSLFTYINNQADNAARALSKLSPPQRTLADAAIAANAGKLPNSDLLRAIEADVKLSGRAAFRVTRGDDE